jgi:amino acid adenylation domain-containing protein
MTNLLARPASLTNQELAAWYRDALGAEPSRFPLQSSASAGTPPRWAHHDCELPPSLTAGLRQRAADLDQESIATVLLAALSAVLHRYSVQTEVVLGAAMSHGLFPLHLDFSAEPSLADLVAALTAALASHAGNAAALLRAFPEMLRRKEVACPVLAHFAGTQALISKLELESAAMAGARTDLLVQWHEQADSIQMRIAYNSAVIEPGAIQRFVAHFTTLLDAAVGNSDRPMSCLPLLTTAEFEQVVVQWNRTAATSPSATTLHGLFERQAERTPQADALICEQTRLSFAEVNARANRLARFLLSRVQRQAIVGVCLPSSVDLMVALLAIQKAGAVCMPLDPKYPRERLEYMIADAGCPLVLTRDGLLDGFSKPDTTLLALEQMGEALAAQAPENPATALERGDLAFVIYTSGSTGTPRGVQLTHAGLVNHASAVVALYGLTGNDRTLQFSSISFDIAIEEIYPTWTAGGAVVLRSEDLALSVGDLVRLVRKQGVTVLDLPTAYWHEWVHEMAGSTEPLPPTLRLVIVGGEKASLAALSRWKKMVGDRVRWINTYGPTEASVIATAYEPLGDVDQLTELPIGRPIANLQTYVLDQHMNPAPVGVAGELHIGGAGVAKGYLNRPELTEQKFVRDPFSPTPGARLYKTGDVVRWRSDGEIAFVGRTDHQVKIHGFRVELGEIDAALAQHPTVSDAVVLVRGDGVEKRVVAYVVPRRECPCASVELRSFLQSKLPAYMVPAQFVILQSLPMTPNGKVDRRALPETPAENLQAAPPRDDLEARLLRVWEEVLQVRPIGVDQNFFELGGHSLLAVRLLYAIEKELGRQLPISVLFQAQTVEELAVLLRRNDGSRAWRPLVAIQPLGSRPPFFCVHGIGGNVLGFYDLARELGPDQPFYGLQAPGLDGSQPCLASVEEMAKLYVREVRECRPSGPYCLGGFSFGGAIAFEMARLLEAAGEKVALVAMLDTYPGRMESKLTLFGRFLRLSPVQQYRYALRKIADRKRAQERRKIIALPPALKHVRKCCEIAARNYTPGTYGGKVLLFRAKQKSLRGGRDPHQAWKQWALGGVEIRELAGDHGSIIRPPQVHLLARELAAYLETAGRNSGPQSQQAFAR